MIENITSTLTHFIINAIETAGFLGIFGLMVAESILFPVPSEVIMPFAGYLASTGKFNIYAVILVGAFANLFGSVVAYILGYWGQETFVRNVINRYGKFLLITVHELDRSEAWFRKYGEKIVLFSRVLPVVRTFISLPAGLSEMNFIRFSIFTFLGSLIWSFLMAYIGFALGKNWNSIEVYYRKFEYLIIFIILTLVANYIVYKFKKLKKTIKPSINKK